METEFKVGDKVTYFPLYESTVMYITGITLDWNGDLLYKLNPTFERDMYTVLTSGMSIRESKHFIPFQGEKDE